MMNKTLLFVVFLLIGVIRAQEDPTWQPDPTTLFTPDVIVLAVEIIPHNEGGELSFSDQRFQFPFPELIQKNAVDVTPSFSPDGQFIAFFGYADETYSVYSYRVDTAITVQLGAFPRKSGENSFPRFDQWVSEIRGTVVYENPYESTSTYYTFDAAQQGSLRELTGWNYYFFDHPPHYESIRTTGLEIFLTGADVRHPCELFIYDAQGEQKYELGYDCAGGRVLSHGRQYYYVRLDQEESVESALAVLDLERDGQGELFTGEIERIESISPNGRYIVLIMDRNGKIDSTNDYATEFIAQDAANTAYVAVFDTFNHHLIDIFKTTAAPSLPYVDFNVRWCGDDCFIHTFNGTHLVRIKEHGVQVSQVKFAFADQLSISPDERYVLNVYNDSITLWDITQLRPISITHQLELTSLEANWVNVDVLRVTMPHPHGRVVYILQVQSQVKHEK